jgi:hypothetical protein
LEHRHTIPIATDPSPDQEGADCGQSLPSVGFGRRRAESGAGFGGAFRLIKKTDNTAPRRSKVPIGQEGHTNTQFREDEMKKLIMRSLLATAVAFGASGVAVAGDENGCTSKTLHGRYVFAARGFTIVAGVPQPKAIVEVIDFDGDGAVSVPRATVSLNGTILRLSPGANGAYTIDDACTGTIEFSDSLGTTFDIVASPRGDEIWMIQVNPNSVFQGTATRTLRIRDDGDSHFSTRADGPRGPLQTVRNIDSSHEPLATGTLG